MAVKSGGFVRKSSLDRRLLGLRLKRQALRGPSLRLGTKSRPNNVYKMAVADVDQPERKSGAGDRRRALHPPVSSEGSRLG